jgi:hypothetical protein
LTLSAMGVQLNQEKRFSDNCSGIQVSQRRNLSTTMIFCTGTERGEPALEAEGRLKRSSGQ